MKGYILIVDDDEMILLTLKEALEDENFKVETVKSGEDALKFLTRDTPDIILLDIWLPGIDGIETLRIIKNKYPHLNVVIMSGHGTIESAVKATKLGAFDFIEKPISLDKLLVIINNLLSIGRLKEENLLLRKKVAKQYLMIGEGPVMRRIKAQLEIAAPTNSWILITGENGTGKELIARAIHEASLRRDRSFITVNCAAIPEELIESELFGHVKGAFTGASYARRGKFDLADEGTIFLDEIGDMSLKTQAKILRILEEQRFERVGGEETIRVDVRVIAATNKDLLKEMREGRFREDLYYRLNVIPFYVSPLRERKEDIPLLVKYFLTQIATENGKKEKEISPPVLEILIGYRWPGNVRELRNVIERMFIMSAGEKIGVVDIPQFIREQSLEKPAEDSWRSANLKEAKNSFEKEYLKRKLEEFDNNITKTAKGIGIERSHLHRKLKQYGLDI